MCSSQVLPCPLCCQPNFESIDALKISLVRVTNRPLFCPICNEILFGLDKLTIHLFSHSLAMDEDEDLSGGPVSNPSPGKILESVQSPSTSSTTTTTTSSRSPQGPNNPTKSSTNSSPASPTLKTATSTATATTTTSTKCDICDFPFESQQHLTMHTNLVHVVGTSSATDTIKFPCHLCNKTFKMKGSLRVHLRVVHMHGFQNLCKSAGKSKDDHHHHNGEQLMSPSCGNESATSHPAPTSNGTMGGGQSNKELSQRLNDAKMATSPDQSKSWICDICTKSFTTKYFLKKHKRLHTGEMPYACTICGKTFTFQQSYHKHLLYHSDEKPHICATCGRAFKELSTLHNHERIHSGEKPFKCETCGKSFRQRVSYLVHRRIHTGSMPYQCTACAKSFRYKVSQRTHKCPAQPPGQVVRQSGELLQKLLLNSSLIAQESEETRNEDEERNRINELIDKSIEDMARGKVDHMNELFPMEEILGIPPPLGHFEGPSLNSPTDQFQNLCLYSHDQPLETLNEESLKDLLY